LDGALVLEHRSLYSGEREWRTLGNDSAVRHWDTEEGLLVLEFPFGDLLPLKFIPAIRYGQIDDTPLLLDMLCPSSWPDAPRPAVMYIFGGGWDSGNRTGGMQALLSPFLASHGFITINITYRLSPQAIFPAQLHDAKAAIRWLRANAQQYHVDPDRIGVWGFSAGAHLASLVGLTGDVPALEGHSGSPGYSSRVQAVVTAAGPSDFMRPGGQLVYDADNEVTRLFGGTVPERTELMRLASPLSHARGDAPPFLIIHGTRDETVLFEQAEWLYHALKMAGSDATLLAREGIGHSWEGGWEELAVRYVAFFRQHLVDGSTAPT
jgi:acetyl esterase/lipase